MGLGGVADRALSSIPPFFPFCHSLQLIYSRLLAMPLPLQSAVASHECTYSPGASSTAQGVVDHHIPTPVKSWQTLLKSHPDTQFAEYIFNGIQSGRIFFLDEVRELSRQNDGKLMTGLHPF